MKRKLSHYYLEITLLILIIVWFGKQFYPADPLMSRMDLHPFWIVVIMTAVRYGYPLGPVAGVICAALHLLGMHRHGVDLISAVHLGDSHMLVPVLYIVVGNFLGQAINVHTAKTSYYEKRAIELSRQLDYVRKKTENLESSYRQLESRIAGQTDTFISMYESSRQFESLSIDEIYAGFIALIKKNLKADKVSVFIKNPDNSFTKKYPVESDEQLPVLARQAIQKSMVCEAQNTLDSYTGEQCLVAGPVIVDNSVAAVVTIDSMPFSEYSFRTIKLFILLLDWTSRSVSKAFHLQEAAREKLFDERLKIESEAYFRALAQEELIISKARKSHSALFVCILDGKYSDNLKRFAIILLAKIVKLKLKVVDIVAFFDDIQAIVAFEPEIDSSNFKKQLKDIVLTFNKFGISDVIKIKWGCAVTSELNEIEAVLLDSLINHAVENANNPDNPCLKEMEAE